MADAPNWRSRIVGYQDIPTNEFIENEQNWRTHSRNQLEPLLAVLQTVGVVQNVIVNQQTGRLVDGHARVLLAKQEGMPSLMATMVDLDPVEEALVLSSLDPLSALAGRDDVKLSKLLDGIKDEVERDELKVMFADMRDLIAPTVEVAEVETGAHHRANPYDKAAAEWKYGEGQSKAHTLQVVVPLADWEAVIAKVKVLGAAWSLDTVTETLLHALDLCYSAQANVEAEPSLTTAAQPQPIIEPNGNVTFPVPAAAATAAPAGPVYHFDTSKPPTNTSTAKAKGGRKKAAEPALQSVVDVPPPVVAEPVAESPDELVFEV